VTATLPSFNSAFPTDWESNPFPSGDLNPDYLPWKGGHGWICVRLPQYSMLSSVGVYIQIISPSYYLIEKVNRATLNGIYDF